MDVPMELVRILITDMGDQQVIFLREKGGERTFPILIGTNEAAAIDRRLKHLPTARPMTHDLLAHVIEAMGGEVEKIVIDDLREHTFIAKIHIRQGTQVLVIDSRPSDAVALGVGYNTPIFVAEHVLDEILKEPSTLSDKVQLLRDRMEMLIERMGDLQEKLADEDFVAQASPSLLADLRRQLEEMRREYDQIDRVLKKLD